MKKGRGFQKSICCFLTDYTKATDGVDHNKLWKILKEIGMPENLIFLLTTYMQDKKHQLESDLEQQTGSKLVKENDKLYIVTLLS